VQPVSSSALIRFSAVFLTLAADLRDAGAPAVLLGRADWAERGLDGESDCLLRTWL